jgi:hypothetical protein
MKKPRRARYAPTVPVSAAKCCHFAARHAGNARTAAAPVARIAGPSVPDTCSMAGTRSNDGYPPNSSSPPTPDRTAFTPVDATARDT